LPETPGGALAPVALFQPPPGAPLQTPLAAPRDVATPAAACPIALQQPTPPEYLLPLAQQARLQADRVAQAQAQMNSQVQARAAQASAEAALASSPSVAHQPPAAAAPPALTREARIAQRKAEDNARAVAFAGLSLPSQRLAIDPADMWPVSAVGWNPVDRSLSLTATQHLARVTVTVIPGTPEALSSIALWWAATTSSLPVLDHKSLRDHTPGLHWAPFREDFRSFATWAASASSTRRTAAHLEACSYASAFDDSSLRTQSFDEFMAALAWEADVKPKIIRISLLHWLSQWGATHAGVAMPSPKPTLREDSSHPCIEQAPVPAARWYSALGAHDAARGNGALVATDILAEFRAAPPTGPVAPPLAPPAPQAWRSLLVASSAGPADAAADLGRLSAVPDAACPQVALALTALARTHPVPARTLPVLAHVVDSATLRAAAKAIYAACPAPAQPKLHEELLEMIVQIEQHYGPSTSSGTLATFFSAAAPILVTLATLETTNWQDLALRVLTMDGIPPSSLAVFAAVTNEETFRAALWTTVTSASPPVPSATLTAILAALTKSATAPPLTELDWFRTPGASSASAAMSLPRAPAVPPTPAPPAFGAVAGQRGAMVGTTVTQYPHAESLPYVTPRSTPSFEAPPRTSGFLPASCPDGRRIVRIQGLRHLPLMEASTALTASLDVMIFITPEDAKRGFGHASIPGHTWDDLFGTGLDKRTFVHDPWEVTVEARRPSGDFVTAPSMVPLLTTPPHSRPSSAPQPRPVMAIEPPKQKKQKKSPRAVQMPRLAAPAATAPPQRPPSPRSAQRAVEAVPGPRARFE
jgi:hypothetical protein